MQLSDGEKAIIKIDDWIIKTSSLQEVTSLNDLGFKQLNDLLLYKYLPKFKEQIASNLHGDDMLLLNYEVLFSNKIFSEFSIHEYYNIVGEKLKPLPVSELLHTYKKKITDVLFQDLTMIAFTVERWGQFILKLAPGTSVKTISIGAETLDSYIKTGIPNYNTLGSFAMTSISDIEGINYTFYQANGTAVNQKTYCYSSYSAYDCDSVNTSTIPNRFPSIMKIDDFPILIKKGELLAQAYNKCILHTSTLLASCNLKDEVILKNITQITKLFSVGTQMYHQFLKTPYFNEAKFIYILRQHTVELSISPATIILEDFELNAIEKVRCKGFLDHYLVRQHLSLNERVVFVQQLLRNEGITDSAIDIFLKKYRDSKGKQELSLLEAILHQDKYKIKNPLLSALIYELITKDSLGEHRIRYAVHLLKAIIPQYSETIDNVLMMPGWIKQKLEVIHQTLYFLPPSGANSIAYYGPDVFLGNIYSISNYDIHMLNRLNVMLPIDQERFWNFEPLKQKNIYQMLVSKASELGLPLYEDVSGKELKLYMKKNPWFTHYVMLFESYSKLTSTHDGVIEKYIWRLGKKMPAKEKKNLVSSPDHGTTYMQPKGEVVEKKTLDIPSLNTIAEIRRNHILKKWVRPLKELYREGELTDYKIKRSDILDQLDSLFFNRKNTQH